VRLWSIHPSYLDRQGLTAAWREALLAQAVLAGRTRGYRHHPQLRRFQAQPQPVAAIGSFLVGLADEADRRGYRYDRGRIDHPSAPEPAIPVTSGQLAHEWQHLAGKLATRSPAWLDHHPPPDMPVPHPLFHPVPGDVAEWEVRREPPPTPPGR